MPVSAIASPRQSEPDAACASLSDGRPSLAAATGADGPARWSLQRNCSLPPASLAAVFCALALVSAAVSGFFWVQGAVLVLPFAALEVAALALAFFWYARHATDGERLWLEGHRLVLEVERAGRVRRETLDATWLEVTPPGAGDAAIGLRAGGQHWRVGQHASARCRARVAEDLRRSLREVRRARLD